MGYGVSLVALSLYLYTIPVFIAGITYSKGCIGPYRVWTKVTGVHKPL